jgi:hypothetical protein
MAPDGILPAVEPSVVRRLFGYFVPPNIGHGRLFDPAVCGPRAGHIAGKSFTGAVSF